jgi:flagellar hook protein FlgE
MQAFQEEMNVIANNMANVNTLGFKGARMTFEDSFSQTLRDSSAGTATSGLGAMQVGTGAAIGSIQNMFGQGTLAQTGVPTDMAISGAGFFTVRDVVSGQVYATRAGDFHTDKNGYLVNDQGMRVQGYTDSGLATLGDIKMDASGAPSTASSSAVYESYSIDPETGKIGVKLSDGTKFTRGQILLQNFGDPRLLDKVGGNLFSGLSSAGPLATPVAPGTAGVGKLKTGALEQSNVDLANEFATLITTQRAFQANTKIITTSDEMLQDMVNLKR